MATTRLPARTPQRHRQPRKNELQLVPSGLGARIGKLQNQVGNTVVARLLQRDDTVVPEVRDAQFALARTMFETALASIEPSLGTGAQLLGDSGQMPGSPGISSGIATTLFSELMVAGKLLDDGIKLYREAGGSLSDIEDLLKVRAHLNNAAYYARLAANSPEFGQMAYTELQLALHRKIKYRVDETLKEALSGFAEQGPMTEAQSIQKQAKDTELAALYLAQNFGPSLIAVKD